MIVFLVNRQSRFFLEANLPVQNGPPSKDAILCKEPPVGERFGVNMNLNRPIHAIQSSAQGGFSKTFLAFCYERVLARSVVA
ncbi:hypothetical protein CA13_35840 [Planctomycetes bacterium CA13]|uniref:Uncharacterized protein n=1 Tax=Novipirellula herctigrandis TaxID=2527986 RepID=A0A5C5Z6H3_9BACT|nr:hypothetical protein CA13_35840 [Planctomycetes bacterium CA13]